jgi:hypothetical protein
MRKTKSDKPSLYGIQPQNIGVIAIAKNAQNLFR